MMTLRYSSLMKPAFGPPRTRAQPRIETMPSLRQGTPVAPPEMRVRSPVAPRGREASERAAGLPACTALDAAGKCRRFRGRAGEGEDADEGMCAAVGVFVQAAACRQSDRPARPRRVLRSVYVAKDSVPPTEKDSVIGVCRVQANALERSCVRLA